MATVGVAGLFAETTFPFYEDLVEHVGAKSGRNLVRSSVVVQRNVHDAISERTDDGNSNLEEYVYERECNY